MHVIGTAGHVDHGKSALVERLTGIDPDRLAEEKRRGLTIDLGFAWVTLPSGAEVGIVDVPGHERFIKNMLAGAGGISICLFVVAANEGWKPQSAEHLAALHVLGVDTAVVALTKSDTVDPETLDLAIEDVREHLAGTSLTSAAIVPCSSLTGEGFSELVAALDAAVSATPPPPDLGRPRLWIDRAFTIAGAGTIVTGTLTGGPLRTGDAVEILGRPRRRNEQARIRALQNHKKNVAAIGPGNRVAVNIAGVARSDTARGEAVVRADSWRTTSRIDALVEVLPESISGVRHELAEKGAHLLYVGSAETSVRIKLLDERHVRAGERGFAQLTMRTKLPLARGDRFVLRDAGRMATFGGGVVLDPMAEPARRNDPARLELLHALCHASAEDALRAHVDANGSMPAGDAVARTGAWGAEGVIKLGSLLVSESKLAELMAEARAQLAAWHSERPLERGMPPDRLRATLDIDPPTLEAFLARLPDIVSEGALVRLESHRVQLSDQQERERARLIETIENGGFSPPMADELNGDSKVIRSLVDSGELVRIGPFYLTRERARRVRELVRARIEDEGPVTVARIRDALGTSRKYAVPLCEWLDATGATVRRGDERLLGPRP